MDVVNTSMYQNVDVDIHRAVNLNASSWQINSVNTREGFNMCQNNLVDSNTQYNNHQLVSTSVALQGENTIDNFFPDTIDNSDEDVQMDTNYSR